MSKIIDEHCKITGSVLQHDNKTYSCILNQTDIANNSNKFYIMQLIKSSDTSFTHFTRWGRTGDTGTSTNKQFDNIHMAIKSFESQFKTKTGNTFDPSKPFMKKLNRYYMSQVSYDDEIEKVKDQIIPQIIPKTNLHEKVQQLLSLLTDTKIMQQSLMTLNIDTKKMPLGKITTDQMNLANGILDKIQTIISNPVPDKQQLLSLSSEYYTYLPMSFGRKKPPIINTQEMLATYKDVINELTNMVVTVKITNNDQQNVNPLDNIYANINTKITHMDKSNPMYSEIEKYINNSHGQTHSYKLELVDVFEIEQNNKKDVFEIFNKDIDNHHLLFHGSGITNWISILKNDLMINPEQLNKNIMISGKMFSNGIYFANCITKSFSYCRTEMSNGLGCIALAQVPLGRIGKRQYADYNITPASLKREKCDSIQGVGKHTPSSGTIINDITIPNGPITNNKSAGSLLYDEFIVYNSNQQLIKYLVLVKNIK
jgi:poly [ADP-ribose] polymerase 2/3/4